ncbi:MAG: hypothetical protein C0501_08855 [Isosphaera sp.]|nr:hypothetical protein [Isosphaera sp.]
MPGGTHTEEHPMIRSAARGLVAMTAVGLVLPAAAQPPAGPADKVVVAQKGGTTKTFDGYLKFTPAGLQVVGTDGKSTPVAPADVLKVTPADFGPVDTTAVRAAEQAEEKKTKADYERAHQMYRDLRAKAAGAPERVQRYLDYKAALTKGRAADETGYDERWAEAADGAAKEWAAFVAGAKGWEVWPATRAAARVYAELGKHNEAAGVWGRLAKNPEVSPDLRLEAAIQQVDAQVRAKAYAPASTAAKALLGATPAPPGQARDRLQVLEAAAAAAGNGDFAKGVADVGKLVAGTKDPVVRGVGHGMLGELHLAAGKPREAMWEFLWVETVYNADRDEAFKAMCRLPGLFKAQGDEDREKAYHEKLRRARGAF